MKVSIIGTGNIGFGLARGLSKAGHSVIVSDRNGGAEAAGKLKDLGFSAEPQAFAEAVTQAEVVILATPFAASLVIADQYNFDGKIVVDVSNPVTDDFSALLVGHNTSAAEALAKQLPGSKLVKAFNTIFAEHYADDLKLANKALQTFVASDDDNARQQVIDLAESIGFEAIAAGALSNARYLEPLGYMNIQFGYMLGRGTGIAPQWVFS